MSKNPVYAQMEKEAMARIVRWLNLSCAQHKFMLRGKKPL